MRERSSLAQFRGAPRCPGGTFVNQTLIVFLAATATALATGLGALPFAFRRFRGDRLLGVSNALAAGVMLGASASLLIEGADRSVPRVIVGSCHRRRRSCSPCSNCSAASVPRRSANCVGADARKAALIIAVMTAGSAAEGVGVGASFGGGDALGLAITIAIAIHNIPEGVTISLVMVTRGAIRPQRGAVEHLHQPPPAAVGRYRLPLRRAVHRDPAGRARLRRRRDGLDGLAGTASRGDRAEPEGPISYELGQPRLHRHARLPNLAPRLTDRRAEHDRYLVPEVPGTRPVRLRGDPRNRLTRGPSALRRIAIRARWPDRCLRSSAFDTR